MLDSSVTDCNLGTSLLGLLVVHSYNLDGGVDGEAAGKGRSLWDVLGEKGYKAARNDRELIRFLTRTIRTPGNTEQCYRLLTILIELVIV